ncbi:MAG: ABC transporter permease [Termitinemataceae bacterium]|nr:MAG: ABC transporter permease [Termitinemataceae bacterium]
MILNIIYAAAPLALAAIGLLLTELSGCIMIASEGFMIFGAFFSYLFTFWTGNALFGIALATILSAFIGFLLITFIQRTGADPFIAALALNLGAQGITASLSRLIFGTSGVLRSLSLGQLDGHTLDGGRAASLSAAMPAQSMFAITALVFCVIVFLFLSLTHCGFRLAAIGLDEKAAAESGIRTKRYIAFAWMFAAFMCALAGAAVSFRVGVYSPGGIAGRGWIAIAAVYLGVTNIAGIAGAALVFAVAEQLTYNVQKIISLNATALLGLPSLMALVLYCLLHIFRRRNY